MSITTPRVRTVKPVAIIAAIAIALSLLTVSIDQRPADSQAAVKTYDTAWDMPFWATIPEATRYLDHIRDAGYDGLWISLFNHTGGGMYSYSAGSGYQTAHLHNGQFQLNQGHVAHVRQILDLAHARGLEVGMVPIWAVYYLNDLSQNGCSGGSYKGPLNASNSYWLGEQVAKAFGNHPALEHWVLGGDNFCGAEDVNIWRNMASAIRNQGANQKMTYHTPGIEGRHTLFANEWWVDFLSPQTGHCVTTDQARRQLAKVVNSTNKPVFAAEMRYEGIQPSWGNCIHYPGNPPTPANIEADARAAIEVGVQGVMFGNNERWQWATGAIGSRGGGTAVVFSTFWSQAEQGFLRAVGASAPPTTAPPTTVGPDNPPPTTGSTDIVIRALGATNQEKIQLQINSKPIATFNVDQGNIANGRLMEIPYTYAGNINPQDVRIAFVNDYRSPDGSIDRNVTIDGIVINGGYYPSNDPAVHSVGGFRRGQDCRPGKKQTRVLACSGYFQYANTAPAAVPPPWLTDDSVAPPTTVRPPNATGSAIQIFAAGATGQENMELRIDNKRVASWTVGGDFNNRIFQERTHLHSSTVTPDRVRIAFTNDKYALPLDRNLKIDRIIIDGVTYQTENSSVQSKGSWSRQKGCEGGFKGTEVLHCNGWFNF